MKPLMIAAVLLGLHATSAPLTAQQGKAEARHTSQSCRRVPAALESRRIDARLADRLVRAAGFRNIVALAFLARLRDRSADY
jgi:hypothetical protein